MLLTNWLLEGRTITRVSYFLLMRIFPLRLATDDDQSEAQFNAAFSDSIKNFAQTLLFSGADVISFIA